MPAGQCSTGEQKALLIGLILAQARAVKAGTGMAPILLLDEVAAHLDRARRKSLLEALTALGVAELDDGNGCPAVRGNWT